MIATTGILLAVTVVQVVVPAPKTSVAELVAALHSLDSGGDSAASVAALEVLRANAATNPWVCAELARRVGLVRAGRYATLAFLSMPPDREAILGIQNSGFCRAHLSTVFALLAGTSGGGEVVGTLSREDFVNHAEELGFWLRYADYQLSSEIMTRAADVGAVEFLPIAARYLASRKVLDRVVHDGSERRQWSLVVTRAFLKLGADRGAAEPEIRAALERCVQIIEWQFDEHDLGGSPSPESDRRATVEQVKAALGEVKGASETK